MVWSGRLCLFRPLLVLVLIVKYVVCMIMAIACFVYGGPSILFFTCVAWVLAVERGGEEEGEKSKGKERGGITNDGAVSYDMILYKHNNLFRHSSSELMGNCVCFGWEIKLRQVQ